MSFIKIEDRILGSMIGAAYGDMLGAGVEFMTLAQIRATYGPQGHTVPVPAYGFPHPVITDDTQMAIATARGIVETSSAALADNATLLRNIYAEYLRWHASQRDPQQRRAPGTTCMSSLRRGLPGSVAEPVNQSMGCGGIMRAHPVGLAFRNDPERAFNIGCESAALTHGHPNGYVPAGLLAAIIAEIITKPDLVSAVFKAIAFAEERFGWDAVSMISDTAVGFFLIPPDADLSEIINCSVGQSIPGKGGGWLGHDCLAIAMIAALSSFDDPIKAVRLAVNHSGDSDSTGSVAGAMVGALYGPQPFLDDLAAHGILLEREDELRALAVKLDAFAKEVRPRA